MQTLRAALLGLRLALAALALAAWIGPAAATGQAMATGAGVPHDRVSARHGADPAAAAGASHHPPSPSNPREAGACCASACGPAVAPVAAPFAAAARERPRAGPPPADLFPPGLSPAPLKPPPRTRSV